MKQQRTAQTRPSYYYATGRNGSVLELRDGRFADTVTGDTSEPEESHEALARLNGLVAEWHQSPEPFGDFNSAQMAEYVGNDEQEDPAE